MKEILVNIISANIKNIKSGTKASYIPALKEVPDKIGIAIRNNDEIFSCGDSRFRFTLQSISKIITLLLALKDNGIQHVFNHVGMEPSGDSFNSISKLDFSSEIKPYNPFINSGAILVTSMIKGNSYENKLKKIKGLCRYIFSRDDINFNSEVYISERENSNRNRALAYLLKEKRLLKGNVEEILDLYFMLCSIEVDCIDLANLGHFLAFNREDRKIDEEYLRITKTLMLSCGMYDYSGEYAVKIGLPSKSGVSGGIVACVPRKMGIGVFSPGLDIKGNSLLGIKMLEELNDNLQLNIFR